MKTNPHLAPLKQFFDLFLGELNIDLHINRALWAKYLTGILKSREIFDEILSRLTDCPSPFRAWFKEV